MLLVSLAEQLARIIACWMGLRRKPVPVGRERGVGRGFGDFFLAAPARFLLC